MDTTIAAIFKWIIDAGGFAGIGALIVVVWSVLKARAEVKTAKEKADSELETAKEKADSERVITRAKAEAIRVQSDETITRAADNVVYTMQRRLDALTNRVEVGEKAMDAKNLEIEGLRNRIVVLERVINQKDSDIVKRDDKIKDLECQITVQAEQIAHLKEQVRLLELAAEKVKEP